MSTIHSPPRLQYKLLAQSAPRPNCLNFRQRISSGQDLSTVVQYRLALLREGARLPSYRYWLRESAREWEAPLLLNFQRKIFLGLGLALVSFCLLVAGSFFALNKIVQTKNTIVSGYAEQLLLSEKLGNELSTQMALMPLVVLTGDPLISRQFEGARARFQAVMETLRASNPEPELNRLFSQILETENGMFEIAQKGMRLRSGGASREEVGTFIRAETREEIQLTGAISSLIDIKTRDFENAKEEANRTALHLNYGLTAITSLTLFLFGVVAALTLRILRHRRQQDQRRAQILAEERKISQARKETVEVVSHDLKSPLATMKMSLDLLSEDLVDSNPQASELRQSLDIALRSARAMENLIYNLLDHSKIEAGVLVTEMDNHCLSPVIEDLVRQLSPLAQQKQIQIFAEGDLQVPLYCDRNRVQQVLTNILGNAMKFTPEKGRVLVRIAQRQKDAVITVQDTGPGIAKAQIPLIFKKFWQAKSTAALGTGLGLSIAKALVEAQGGQIWVESEVGHGTEVHFTLALAKAELAPKPLPFDSQGASQI